MSAQGTETVTACHGLNLSHSLWDSQPGSTANQLRLKIIRPIPRVKLSPGVHT